MKKLIIILCNISIVAWILFLISALIFYGKGLRSEFLFRCILGILSPFMVPVFFHFSLINRKNKWKPVTWMIVYLITLLILIVPFIRSGELVGYIKDLPLALKNNYSKTSSSIQIINQAVNGWTIEVNGIEFKLPEGSSIDDGIKGTIIYLPHSKYILGIIDENGKDLINK